MQPGGRNKDGQITGTSGVKYGLQPTRPAKAAKPSIFGNDDEEQELANDRNAAVRAQQGSKRIDYKSRQQMAAALVEDPNCFEYDAFYDGIQSSRAAEEQQAYEREQAGPQFLGAMRRARDERQRHRDIAYQRREAVASLADADVFADKESFATAGYKRKLEEDRLFQVEMEARDKAAEETAVDKAGMDGVVSMLQATMSARPAANEDAAGSSHGEHGGEDVDNVAKVRAKRAKALAAKQLENLDKYERRRLEMERELREGGSAADPSHAVGGAQEVRAEGETDGAAALAGNTAAPHSAGVLATADVAQTDGAPSTAQGQEQNVSREDRIRAAKERAAARRDSRLARG